jgi:DNA-directed RNA polymerase subunit RPC12/RpoP
VTIDNPRFTVVNESFDCHHCGREVPRASSTCRDHCPHCLHSLHVDNNPGDRAANCGGDLVPVGYIKHKKKGFMIQYRCARCGTEKVNQFLEYDSTLADSFNTLLALTPNAIR